MHIAIAGGGLVGLTTAASLHRIGHDVTVLEQAPEVRAAGTGIGLWENALHEFDEIGIGSAVRALGPELDPWYYDPAGKKTRSENYKPDKMRLIPRPALNTLLADTIGRDRIRPGARVIGFTEHDDRVDVELAGGGTETADLLIGADGVYSQVRAHLLPGTDARPHDGHYAWRAIVPAGDERREGTVLTIGRERTRGGYTRIAPDRTMWMVNQFAAGPLTGSKRDRALARARNLAEPGGWHEELLRMIARTPEDAILENQIMLVPPLPRWSSTRVTLIGDAAHGLSPHISAGGTLGIEDVTVLRQALGTGEPPRPALETGEPLRPAHATGEPLRPAHATGEPLRPPLGNGEPLRRYEQARIARFARVREFADAVETASDSQEFADRYAAFTDWMLTTAPDEIR